MPEKLIANRGKISKTSRGKSKETEEEFAIRKKVWERDQKKIAVWNHLFEQLGDERDEFIGLIGSNEFLPENFLGISSSLQRKLFLLYLTIPRFFTILGQIDSSSPTYKLVYNFVTEECPYIYQELIDALTKSEIQQNYVFLNFVSFFGKAGVKDLLAQLADVDFAVDKQLSKWDNICKKSGVEYVDFELIRVYRRYVYLDVLPKWVHQQAVNQIMIELAIILKDFQGEFEKRLLSIIDKENGVAVLKKFSESISNNIQLKLFNLLEGLMSENIIIGKHTLESLTSGMYSEPFVVFREYIQNSADSIDGAIEQGILKADDNQITVKLAPLDKRIIIRDNGLGLSEAEAEKTLISIGNSKKSPENSRGFRGIGRLCALSYCEKLTFITSATNELVATKIVIDADKLSELLANDTGEDVTVIDVLQNVYTVELIPEKVSAHYFTVQMDGVKENSKLNSYDDVIDYLTQNVPAPYSPNFVWGKEITNRIKHEGYNIDVYNINVVFGTVVTSIYKPYRDEFLVDKSKSITDQIQNIDVVKVVVKIEAVVQLDGLLKPTILVVLMIKPSRALDYARVTFLWEISRH